MDPRLAQVVTSVALLAACGRTHSSFDVRGDTGSVRDAGTGSETCSVRFPSSGFDGGLELPELLTVTAIEATRVLLTGPTGTTRIATTGLDLTGRLRPGERVAAFRQGSWHVLQGRDVTVSMLRAQAFTAGSARTEGIRLSNRTVRLVESCTTSGSACGGRTRTTMFDLELAGTRLSAGSSWSEAGETVHFIGAAESSGAGTRDCIVEGFYSAAITHVLPATCERLVDVGSALWQSASVCGASADCSSAEGWVGCEVPINAAVPSSIFAPFRDAVAALGCPMPDVDCIPIGAGECSSEGRCVFGDL